MGVARQVTRKEFEEAMEAVWSEIEYQNSLPRRTEEAEAQEPPAFLTLGNVYNTKTAEDWAMQAGDEPALHGLRKLAGIYLRGMVYCGVRYR